MVCFYCLPAFNSVSNWLRANQENGVCVSHCFKLSCLNILVCSLHAEWENTLSCYTENRFIIAELGFILFIYIDISV